MELVNIVYRYVNRFINSEKLVEQLTNIDKSKLSKKESKEIEKLLEEVKNIIETVPIEIDQIEINRLTSLNHLLESLEKMKENDKNSAEAKEFIDKKYASLQKEKDIVKDSGPRYEELYKLLVNNSLYINYCKKMSDLELLELITQYISAPVTLKISQETFNDLVAIGIKDDNREALWRLAFNYYGRKKDFTRIEDYFIKKKDDFYITELISAVKEDLDIERLIEKVINTKDKSFIYNCGKRARNIGLFSKEEFTKLKNKIGKINIDN